MILNLHNGLKKHVPVFGAMGGPHVDTFTLDVADIRMLLQAPEGHVREYLSTMYMRFYPILDSETAAARQSDEVETHNFIQTSAARRDES